jgi:SAM-dependent methyltransferase
MAEFARQTGVDAEVSTFETWDAAGRTFDAVVAGQAWHWVDPVAGAAKAAEVLRPNGSLTLFWHVFEPPAEVRDATTAAYRRAVPDSPFGQRPDMRAVDMYQTMVTKALDALGPEFGDQQRWRFEWTRHYTRAEWLDLLPTTGGLTRLPADKLADILDAVGAAIDDTGFTMSYTTLAGTAQRQP